MAIRYNSTFRNTLRDAFKTAYPATTAIIEIRGTPQQSTPDSAATGTLLAEVTVAAWTDGTGQATLSGTWQDASANNAGTATHYRLRNAGDTNREDGTVTATGGGGDLTLDNTSIAAGQQVTITAFTRTMPGA